MLLSVLRFRPEERTMSEQVLQSEWMIDWDYRLYMRARAVLISCRKPIKYPEEESYLL